MCRETSRGLIALIACLPVDLRADGIPSYYDSSHGGWNIAGESDQLAVVALDEGYETLLLQVRLTHGAPASASQLVWLTPIPAAASQVDIDILRGFPRFSGKEPVGYIASSARTALSLMAATQLFPAVLLITLSAGREGDSGISVHQTVNRDGVEAQLVSAASRSALEELLQARSIALPEQAIESLESYVGDSACFILYRIADLPAHREATRDSLPLGVQVRFPTDEGFFPLKASSALPEMVRVSVVVTEFVTPIRMPVLMSAKHYVGRAEAGSEVRTALRSSLVDEDQHYTRFEFRGPAGLFTDDLRFRPGAPAATRMAAAWMVSPHFSWVLSVIALIVFVLVSFSAALCARLVWPVAKRPSLRTTAVIAACNFFTVVVVFIAAMVMATRADLPGGRGVAYTATFSLTFCAILLVLALFTATVG